MYSPRDDTLTALYSLHCAQGPMKPDDISATMAELDTQSRAAVLAAMLRNTRITVLEGINHQDTTTIIATATPAQAAAIVSAMAAEPMTDALRKMSAEEKAEVVAAGVPVEKAILLAAMVPGAR